VRRTKSTTLTYILLTIAAMVAAAPLAGVIIIAFYPPNAPVSGLTLSHLNFSNIVQVWQTGDFGGTLTWSTIIALVTVIITVGVSVPAGFAFATIRFPGRSHFFYSIILGLLLPPAAVLIPVYYEIRSMHLTGSAWSVILPTAGFSIAFGVFWMRAAFLSLPRELIEAASIDGATTNIVLTKVALPLVRAPAMVLVLLTFVGSWHSFLIPLVMLAGSNVQTAPLSLAAFQGGHVDDIPGMAASAVFILLPAVLIYLLTQRHFIRGLTEGGIKM